MEKYGDEMPGPSKVPQVDVSDCSIKLQQK